MWHTHLFSRIPWPSPDLCKEKQLSICQKTCSRSPFSKKTEKKHHTENAMNVQSILFFIKTRKFGLKMAVLTFTLLKLSLVDGCFSRFLNCSNGTKSRNAPQICLALKIEETTRRPLIVICFLLLVWLVWFFLIYHRH